MKKSYESPKAYVEEFTPNEYVAACYHGVCNISGYVFTDTNGNGQYDPGIDKYKYKNTACNHDYWIEGQDATLPDQNAFVFQRRKYVSDGLLSGHYEGLGTPVSAWNFDRTHTTTKMDLEERPNHS